MNIVEGNRPCAYLNHLWPDLIREYRGTSDVAIICAIGRQVKVVPDMEDLDTLESLVPHAKTNVAKGFIVNALAESIAYWSWSTLLLAV